LLDEAKGALANYKQRVKNLSPTTILNKGFAIVMINNQIVTDPKKIAPHAEIKTYLKNEIIHSTVTQKTKNEKRDDL
jgi:exodeoxyribonuclease VII large subunit